MSVSSPTGSPPFTPRAKKVLELSLREALQLNHSYIGTEHILLGLVREGNGVAATVLVEPRCGSRAGPPGGEQPHDRRTGEAQHGPTRRRTSRSVRRTALPPPRAVLSAMPRERARTARFRTMAIPSDDGDVRSDVAVRRVLRALWDHVAHVRRRRELANEAAERSGRRDAAFRLCGRPALSAGAAAFLLRPSRDGVTLTDDGLFVATFGLVKIATPRANVAGAHITGTTAGGRRSGFACRWPTTG